MTRILITLLFCLLIGLKSSVLAQSIQIEQATTSIEIEKDYYFRLLKEKIKDKIIRRDSLNNPELEVILASIGYPQNAEFFVIQLTFFKDSLYLYEHKKDKRFEELVSFSSNKVKSDSVIKSVASYFDKYQENHIQKYLSKKERKRNDFQNLRSIVIRKHDSDNIIFLAVNGTEYSNENDNLPDSKLYEILKLMRRNYAKYFNIPLD